MSAPIGIRGVTAGGAAELIGLFDHLGHPASSEDLRSRITRLLSDGTYTAWIAEDRTGVLGFAAGHLVHPIEDDHPAAQLIALVADPEHRGRGVGTALRQEFERWALAQGVIRLVVSSGIHRHASHEFYENRGHVRSGLRFSTRIDG